MKQKPTEKHWPSISNITKHEYRNILWFNKIVDELIIHTSLEQFKYYGTEFYDED